MTDIDSFFLLMGAILVFAMHAGFAFLEAGTVREKNQVNSLTKILTDFAISTVAYLLVGYSIAYGVGFFASAETLSGGAANPLFPAHGLGLMKFFFLLTFAAAIPAIVSGGIAERARFLPQCIASAALVGLLYPFFEGIVWNGNYGIQAWIEQVAGAPFHDFAGSVVVHAVGGWIGLAAVLLLGNREGRYTKQGQPIPILPSNVPFLALGSWLLCIGWFGFNVVSAQSVAGISGLVAVNSLLALAGGIFGALIVGNRDTVFIYNGALAGLVAVCAGSDVMHPFGALATGMIAGIIFVRVFLLMQNRWRIDDVLGVWPLHGICGVWGGIACGIFGAKALGGIGGVSILAQLLGSGLGVAVAFCGGFAVYFAIRQTIGFRMTAEAEYAGADKSIHKISARN